MPEPLERTARKITIRIWDDDWKVLREWYGTSGYNQPIRDLVAEHVRWIKEQQRKEPK